MAMQLNSKSFESTRKALALWHIADFNKADENVTKAKRVSQYNKVIATDKELLDKLLEEKLSMVANRTESDLREEIKKYAELSKAESERVKALTEEYSKDIKTGRDLVSADLLKSIKAYVSDIYNPETEQNLANALVSFFTGHGVKDATIDDVKPYMRALGVKRNSARKMCELSKHNGVATDTVLIDTFLGAICDEPVLNSLLPIKKWENIIEKKVAEKVAKNK